MSDVVFERQGDTFVPTEFALSPWGPQSLHGGSAAALMAHGVEQAKADPALMVTRMTMDLFRTVPKAPLRMETVPARTGRRIQVMTTSLFADEVEVARATALMLLPSEVEVGEATLFLRETPEGPDSLATTRLMPKEAQVSNTTGLHTTVQARRVTEHNMGKGGRAVAWLRFPLPFIEGVETTPLMRVAATSDFGNGIAHIRPNDTTSFINADITLYLHREAVGEWIGVDVTSAAEPHGIGLIQGRLFDERGPVGTLNESLLANRRVG